MGVRILASPPHRSLRFGPPLLREDGELVVRESGVRGQGSEVRGRSNASILVVSSSPPFQGGGDRAFARWGGLAQFELPSRAYFHAPSP